MLSMEKNICWFLHSLVGCILYNYLNLSLEVFVVKIIQIQSKNEKKNLKLIEEKTFKTIAVFNSRVVKIAVSTAIFLR